MLTKKRIGKLMAEDKLIGLNVAKGFLEHGDYYITISFSIFGWPDPLLRLMKRSPVSRNS